MASSSEPLALIAGSSQMPSIVARQARARGRRVTVLAIRGITDTAVGDAADEIRWLDWGDVNGFLELLGELGQNGVREAVMAGKVEQQRIYEATGAGKLESLLEEIPVRHTDALIKTVANLLAAAGIDLVSSMEFLDGLLVAAGTLTQRSPNEREMADIEHGWKVAKALGGLDIGQAVVVKELAVVAVEAMEGTDACILRAGLLAGPGTVVIKVAKPRQDPRFDLPVVGMGTVASMSDAGATALAIEADRTVVFDRERVQAEADVRDLAIVSRRLG
ncbi:MAG: LpxI family protein [Acidobacteriota bacterium]